MQTSRRKPGERIWDHTDPATTVSSPLGDWVKAPKVPTAELRVEVVSPNTYHVTNRFGETWEVALLADMTLEIIFPDDVSGETKRKVLRAVRSSKDYS